MKTTNQYQDVEREIKAAFKLSTRIVLAAAVVLILVATWAMQGCSTRSLIVSPDGAVNASATAFVYCPEAILIRAGDVEMLSEASGVGAVVQSLGNNAAEVMRP